MPTALASPSSLPTPASFTPSLTMPITITRHLLEPINSTGLVRTQQVVQTGFLVTLLQMDTRNFLWWIHATLQRHTTSSVWQKPEPTTQTPLLVSMSTTTTVPQYSLPPVVPRNSGLHLLSGHKTRLFFLFSLFFCHRYNLCSTSSYST